MKSYSQDGEGEDLYVKSVFGDTKGSLLDIGAWDPYEMSNSRMLIEEGWKAVLIELSPKPLRALAEAYNGSPFVTVIQAAVVLEKTPLVKMRLTDDAVSSSDIQVIAQWDTRGGYYGWAYIATITLADIMHQFGAFDFVNIDVEGGSVPLAIQLMNTEMYPRCICVEHDDIAKPGNLRALQANAQRRGYSTRLTNSTNTILVRE